MRRIAYLILILWTSTACAQQPIISTVTDFIAHNQFARADQYLDSILQVNPKTTDALMMKGNVLLNEAWNNASKSHFNAERAESVFDSSVIDASYLTPIIPLDTSIKIERIWNTLDSTRFDIKKGLCSLYSYSLRTAELEKLLKQMAPVITQSEDNAFTFAEYARNLKNRGRFEDGMRIYSVIANMFPDLAGIRCDMANEYFYEGQMDKALAYLDSTLSKKEIDQTSYINAAALYSVLGYYDKAYHTFKLYSDKDTLLEADFYKGLMMFASMDTGFNLQMHRFLDHASEQSYYDEIQIARKLLPFGHIPFTIADFEDLVNNPKIARYYKVLILQRGIKQFKDNCEPRLLLGTFECSIKNYSVAINTLQDNAHCNFNAEQEERRKLVSAYAFYKLKQPVSYIETLFTAKSNFVQQAGKYFMAKLDWEAGKKEEAKKLFEEVAKAKIQTKYSWLSKGYLGR